MMAAALRMFLVMVLALIGLTTAILSQWMPWPWALLSGIAATIVIHGLVVAAGIVMAHVSTRGVQPAGIAGWFRAWPAETAISLRNMYLDIPWRHTWAAHLPAGAKGSLLLVHGYGCNRGIWHGVHSWLASLGWAVDAPDLEPPHASIDEFGAQVAAAAARLCARTGHPSVVIIAHSMGGLAARAALRADPNAPISHVITVGTPHHGTWHARLGRGICATQMLPRCNWLCALLAFEGMESASRFTCIASHHDNIVSPADNATLNGARQLVLDGVGHMALLYDKSVRDRIELSLEEFKIAR